MIIVGKKFDIRIIILAVVLFGIDIFWQIYVGKTSFTYTIELLPLENSDITDIVITDYATIDENTDLNNITKKAYNNSTITNNVLYDNTTTNFKHKPFRIRLYFCWKDDATNTMDDNADTIIGEKAANGEEINFKISASISFNQYIS